MSIMKWRSSGIVMASMTSRNNVENIDEENEKQCNVEASIERKY